MFKKDPTIYIGYDQREQAAFGVLTKSIEKFSSFPVHIVPLNMEALRRVGLYRRGNHVIGSQYYDDFDMKPFSTEFSFTRFLVPHLNQYSGQALFIDCDMMFRADPMELFEMCEGDTALHCVKHDYTPQEGRKMDNMIQQRYPRKNWTSLMVFNCEHPAHLNLTVDDVNTKSGLWLHNLRWLDNYQIGSIPEEWNWLDHWSPETIEAKNVHFTTGGPWFPDWKPSNPSEEKYVQEWKELYNSNV